MKKFLSTFAIFLLLLCNVAYATQLGSGLNVGATSGYMTEIANDTSTGTTINSLAKLTSSGKAIITATTDTQLILGVVVNWNASSALGGSGTTGNAVIATTGIAPLTLDGTGTNGDFVVESTTTGGEGHDTGSGSTCPGGNQVIGKVVAADTGNIYWIQLGSFGCAQDSAASLNVYTGHGTYTWTKPTNAVLVKVWALGAGSGGGSGAMANSGTSVQSGGSGCGGAYSFGLFVASGITSTVTVTVGQGGAGGAAVTSNTTGNVGGVGNNSTFGSYLTGYAGGVITAYNGTCANNAFPWGTSPVVSTPWIDTFGAKGIAGGQGGGSSPSTTQPAIYGGAGGGSGAGNFTSPSTQSGGAAGTTLGAPSGGGGGTSGGNGSNGTNPSTVTPPFLSGTGGGGGANCITTSCTAGNGGSGGYGSGGGGGGGALGPSGTSGAGGVGGDGVVVVETE